MTNLLTKYEDWQSGIRARRLAKWPRLRQKGKLRFVAGFGLIWCVVVNTLSMVSDFAFNHPMGLEGILFRLVFGALVGLLIGNLVWNEREKEFLSNSKSSIERAEIAAIK